MATHEAPRMEVSKPRMFNDKRDANLWHMERYIEVITLMAEAIKVRTATRYLTNNVTLWWHWRFVDIENRTCTIDT